MKTAADYGGRTMALFLKKGAPETKRQKAQAVRPSAAKPLRQVWVDRDSVCMGDDVQSHKALLDYGEDTMLSDIFGEIARRVPGMPNAIWAVDSGFKPLGYILMNQDRQVIKLELCQPDMVFAEMDIRGLYCSYYERSRFIERRDGAVREIYPECESLLAKVKRSMRARFQEEMLIRVGSLRLWGEWFGEPYERFLAIERVKWSETEIVIGFDQGECLRVTDPTQIINEENRLIIVGAARVQFCWYDYGKDRSYENLYVRQYTVDSEGRIFRAAGARSQVRNTDAEAFEPADGNAVCLIRR